MGIPLKTTEIITADEFLHYQSLPSLREYVLITQDVMQSEIFRRGEKHKWEYERLNEPTDIVNLETLQFSISLAELYKAIRIHATTGACLKER